jgi:hypothetical protein
MRGRANYVPCFFHSLFLWPRAEFIAKIRCPIVFSKLAVLANLIKQSKAGVGVPKAASASKDTTPQRHLPKLKTDN